MTDRGPNLFISQAVDDYRQTQLENLRGLAGAKVMPLPEAGAEIVALHVDSDVRVLRRMPLQVKGGRRLSGAPLSGGDMEAIFDLAGGAITPDRLGADTEAIAVLPDGSFVLAEEYGPSLLLADPHGQVVERWVADGRQDALSHPDLPARGVLPKRVADRKPNRGIEALCASADGRWLYLALQSAAAGGDAMGVPVWKLDARTGALQEEWVYPFDLPETFRRDAARRAVGPGDLKVCEFAWAGEDTLVVLERIAHSTKIYRVDLARLPEKTLLFSSDDHAEVGPDMEGMALLSPTEILLVSDNDFGVEGADTEFWRVTLGVKA